LTPEEYAASLKANPYSSPLDDVAVLCVAYDLAEFDAMVLYVEAIDD
jgi:hypothetical protein